ncbi:zinc finger, CCHC-type containing protein [Tanacetum coccineum]
MVVVCAEKTSGDDDLLLRPDGCGGGICTAGGGGVDFGVSGLMSLRDDFGWVKNCKSDFGRKNMVEDIVALIRITPSGIPLRCDFGVFTECIRALGLKKAPNKFDETGKGVIICLYVDDIIIFGTDQVHVVMTKEFLSSRFSMNDMGEADVFIGIQIKHEGNGIAISQSHYIEKVLKKFNYFDCTPVSTRMDRSEKFMPNNGQVVSQLEYSRVVGCLIYVMTCIRPDMAFVVGKLTCVDIVWKLLVLQGGSPTGIHGLFSGRYCGLAGRMVTLRGNRVIGLYWIGLVVHASLYDSSFIVLQCFLYYHSEYRDDKKDCALFLVKLAMSPFLPKKFRMGVAIATGRKGYYKPGTRAWLDTPGKFLSYQLTDKEKEFERMMIYWEQVEYEVSDDDDSDLKSTARSVPKDYELEDTGSSNGI